MSIYLFGCKDTSLHVARFLKRRNVPLHLVTISPALAEKHDVAGYLDLNNHAELFESVYTSESYNLKSSSDVEHFATRTSCTLGFCVGWQRLIPPHVLQIFTHGIHGMHGSPRDLPFGKGRSPMNWSLIEGRKFFFTNLFRYLDGVDNGPVVDTVTFSIQSSDTAETLHYKNTLSMCSIIEKNLPSLLEGKVTYCDQNLREGESFYPKREPADGKIDWRDDIFSIERLIRAVAPPFYGALAYDRGAEIRIFRGSVFYIDMEKHPFLDAPFGEVVDIFPNGKFLVRCSGGVLIVHECSNHSLDVGSRLELVDSPFKRFTRNEYGFFDV